MIPSPLIQRRMQISFAAFSQTSEMLLLQKLPRPKNNFGIKTIGDYYKQIQRKCEGFVSHNAEVTSVEKVLITLDVAKASGIDQISAKVFKHGAPVIAIYLAYIINLLIKLDTFLSQCKIAKIKPSLKKRIKTEVKNYSPISLFPLIPKVI